MKLKKLNNEYYLLSDSKFIQPTIKGTEYYDGEGNIRLFGTGNCFNISSKNILAATTKVNDSPLLDKSKIESLLGIVDVAKAAKDYAKTQVVRGKNLPEWDDKTEELIARYFTEGAKIYSDNKFTLEDMRNFANKCFAKCDDENFYQLVDDEIELLSKEKTEWDVEVETYSEIVNISVLASTTVQKPKVTEGFINITKIN